VTASVHLVSVGEQADERLVADAVRDLVHRLVGDGDRTLMVDDFDGDDDQMAAVVAAARTPPFLTERRVVVVRRVGRFGADDVAALATYVRDPCPSTDLVLVGGGGRLARLLTDAVKAAGGTRTSVGAPRNDRDRSAYVAEAATAAGLTLDPRAVEQVARHLGEDVARVGSLVATLHGAYGAARRLTVADVAPFLGDAGGVPPWDLTDAIDGGDAGRALELLARLLVARHPLVVLATLQGHYQRMLRLDGAGAHDRAAAAAVLGIKEYPAGKALDGLRRLGPAGLRRAMALLAEADSDLRGGKDWPEGLVLEVLVARLSRLVPADTRRATPRRASSR
jgi:DNA polymerase-3 subunit delta